MKSAFLIILLWSHSTIFCDDGFVTIWAPKNLNQYKNFNITFLSKNIPEQYSAGIEFNGFVNNLVLENEEFITISVDNSKVLNINRRFNLAVTLFSNERQKCSTKNFVIIPEARKYYTFIQTDKPIYKPGDKVKFRILVVDRDMRPFHMNNIKVDFIDPLGRTINTFPDLAAQYLGIYENSFDLSTSTILGDWKIQAIVDTQEEFPTEKSFGVQKYVLPLFEVQVETSGKHYLIESDMTISFYAKYSFGEFVTGNAELIIRDPKNKKIFYTKKFKNISEVEAETYNIKSDFKIGRFSKASELEAVVTITEPESGIKLNKTAKFYVHKNPTYRLVPLHPPSFTPNSKFEVKVLVKDFKDEQVMEHPEDVQLKYSYITKGRRPKQISEHLEIIDGFAKTTIVIPKNVIKFNLEIKFASSDIYKKEIKTGAATGAINVLLVDHTPKNPKLGDIVNIYVEGESEMDKIFVVVSSNNGNVQNQVVDCNDETYCEFDIVIRGEMMPHSTVSVYHVKDKLHIYQGFTQIGTENIKGNHLKLDLSTDRAKTKDKIQMNFATSANSKIYLLAFDKSLKFLRDGNDITRDDVVSAISNYDGDSQVMVNDLSSWSDCTSKERDRLDPFATRFNSLESEEGEEAEEAEPKEPSNLRQDFPETWIFESFEIGNRKTAIKEFTAPDSITTWLISAFSLNKDKGLAMAPTQELIVMNEFFVKMNLPYSIKFKEVLRLDILVYNYIETRNYLDVDVELENLNGKEFQFVEYSKVEGVCIPIYNNKTISLKTTKVSHTAVKKVSFHIRYNSIDEEFDEKFQKKIQLKVIAKANGTDGRTYEDQVLRKLTIEPVGVRDYTILTEDHILNGSEPKRHEYYGNYTDGLAGLNVIVGGDYLGNAVEMSRRFQLYPDQCLEQQTSRIKGNVEYFRYLLSREKNPERKHFSDLYQSLLVQKTKNWSYSSSTGFRAYFLEAMASAIVIRALPINDKIIDEELKALKNKQNPEGDFTDFGAFPEFDKTEESSNYHIFETAYVLIPFLKLRNTRVGKNYKEVIRKAFNYLNSNVNKVEDSKEGLALAAYAYGLSGNKSGAENLLEDLDEASFTYPDNKKCFKIKKSDEKCDMRHTSYVALAYLSIRNNLKASQLVHWLVKDMNLKYLYSSTHEYAVATEPIAKIARTLNFKETDFKVTLKNEFNFTTTTTVTKKNCERTHYVEFPKYSHDVFSVIEGSGYCSITALYEKIVTLRKVVPAFNVTAGLVKTSKGKRESTFEVCAEYNLDNYVPLFNVIYEVEMPSGYVYAGIEDLEKKQSEIKLVQARREGSLVYIYYNDFKRNNKYCVGIKAGKSFEVMDIKPAGVKVYDYNDKTNVAIEFYSAVNPTC